MYVCVCVYMCVCVCVSVCVCVQKQKAGRDAKVAPNDGRGYSITISRRGKKNIYRSKPRRRNHRSKSPQTRFGFETPLRAHRGRRRRFQTGRAHPASACKERRHRRDYRVTNQNNGRSHSPESNPKSFKHTHICPFFHALTFSHLVDDASGDDGRVEVGLGRPGGAPVAKVPSPGQPKTRPQYPRHWRRRRRRKGKVLKADADRATPRALCTSLHVETRRRQ